MKLPRTDQTKDGPVTTIDWKHTWLDKIPCIYVHVRGPVEAYFGPPEDNQIYRFVENADGTWEAWYHSTDPVLCETRDQLVALGEWAR